MKAPRLSHLVVEEEHHAKERLHEVMIGLLDGGRHGEEVLRQRDDAVREVLRVQHAAPR